MSHLCRGFTIYSVFIIAFFLICCYYICFTEGRLASSDLINKGNEIITTMNNINITVVYYVS